MAIDIVGRNKTIKKVLPNFRRHSSLQRFPLLPQLLNLGSPDATWLSSLSRPVSLDGKEGQRTKILSPSLLLEMMTEERQQTEKGKKTSRKYKNFAEFNFCRPFLVVIVVSFAKNTGAHQIATVVVWALEALIDYAGIRII